MRKKIHIRQTDSYDCGAACLASVAAWWDIRLPLSRFRRECGCSKDGISIRGLADGANNTGLRANPLKAENFSSLDNNGKVSLLRTLAEAKAPVIAHTITEEGMLHYVAIFEIKRNKLQVMDPAKDRMKWVGIGDFAKKWSGYIVLVCRGEGVGVQEKTVSRRARLLRLIAFHRREIILAMAGSISLTGIGICNSLLLQLIIDKILPSSNMAGLFTVSLIIVMLIPVSLLIAYLRDVYMLQGGLSIDSSLIMGFMRRILKMDARFFRDYPKGELESRLGDTYKIRAFICEGMVSAGVCIITLAVVSALMFTFYRRLAVILMGCIPAYILLLGIADKVNRKMSRKVMAAAAEFESDVIDSMEGHAAIRHFNTNPDKLKFNGSYSEMIFRGYKAGKLSAVISGLNNGISQIIMGFILIIGGAGVVYGRLSLGELVSFYTLSAFFISATGSIVGFNAIMNEALVASDRIYDITSSYTSLADSEKGECFLSPPQNGSVLEFRNVEFRYPGGRKLLEGFNASFKPGSITLIEGPSGCGKSTLTALMLKDYSPIKGKITYGGIEIGLYKSSCWRNIISAVPQNSHLFNATIFDNITMTPGRREGSISQTEMQKAANAAVMAGMGPMIERLEKGLFSNAGPSGVSLSGGERQMILVARMLYAEPQILIFDEAFSNMDKEGRRNMAELMKNLREKGKCVIVVSHEANPDIEVDNVIKLTG